MNKHLPNSLRVLFLSLAVLLSLPMLAVEVEIDGINYDLNAEAEQTTVIQKSSGEYSGEVVIPESVEHEGVAYSVTSIGNYAFEYCDGLTSVTIPNSVTSIGQSAFDGCSALTSVHISDIAAWCNIDFENDFSNPLFYAHHLYLNGEEVKDLVIPNSVTIIGDRAFYDCKGLTSVTIGNSVTSIGEWAFSYCSGLTSVTIGNSVTSIGNMAFVGCSGLTSVTIGNSVTSIGSSAFHGCSGLTSVTIPNSVTSIGWFAFRYCSGLTSIVVEDGNTVYDSRNNCNAIIETASNMLLCGCKTTIIPNSVTSIGHGAFVGCFDLTSVTIPNSVTSIGNSAFDGCSGLTSVTIPNSVTSIGEEAFDGCSGLTSVTIGNSVTSLGSFAFMNCTGLTSVTIPNSVTSIGEEAFFGCHFTKENFVNNSSLSAEENNYWRARLHDYETEDGLLIDSTSVAFCRKNADVIAIPNGVTSIGESAFSGCSGLTSLTIPNSVTSIGRRAFSGCSGLTSLTIPNSVTSIGEYAFNYCSGLTSVTIGNSVTSIGEYAFSDCSGLTSVTIPNSVTSIGGSAFSDCSGLTSVTIGNSVTSIGRRAFYGCSGLTSVHILDIAAWCNIDFPGSYSNPLYYAHHLYLNGEEVRDLVIPNSVTSIGGYAFDGCSGLTSVTIPNSVTSIGNSAFKGCSELLDVYCYAENVPSTKSSAFTSSSIADATLHVPAASIDSYKATRPWRGFGKIVALTPDETGITETEIGNVKYENSAIFDLSGRRVQKAQKGIFIRDGKVVVK